MAELTSLGRYQLRRVLGKGAMGVVYEGFDPTLGRHVAIKTILKSAALDDETERAYTERFEKEAKAVARLNHPHIIQVHDFGVQDDVAYLVMEFIRGRELRSYFVEGEPFGAEECVRIMGELLDALDFAHEAGVVHRDVKPANVMLDAQRRVKLADFGVARVQDSDRSAAGTMVGTPAFMSPEQIQGLKIDRRTDVFSAGVILYQLLTGEQPFKGAGAWTVAKKIMQDDPPHPSTVVPSVSPAFDAIVARALAKQAAERYSSAKEFAIALRATLGQAPAAAIAPPPRPQPVPKPTPAAGTHASDTELEFWRSIQNSGAAAEFEIYLRKFPGGMYAELAQIKLDKLRGGQSDATVAIPQASVGKKKSTVALPAGIAAALVASGVAAYLFLGRAPAPEQAPPTVAPVAAPRPVELSPADIEKIRAEAEARIRREYADKSASEQAAARAAAEKALQEKQLAARVAVEKAAVEKAAAEKTARSSAAERAAAEKAAAERAASERAAAERSASERAAAEKAAMEKAAAEKAASEKLAAEKAAAEKAAAEKVAAEKAAAQKAVAEKSSAANAASALEQFKARHGRYMVVDVEPARMLAGHVLYINDKSCPEGQIHELTAGSIPQNLPRRSRCIKLTE